MAAEVQILEPKVLLTPLAMNDSFNVAHDHTLNGGVQSNDFPYMGITSSLVSECRMGR